MSIRTERIARLLQRELADIINTSLKDDLPALVTLTGVRVSGDLAIATVYVSVLGRSDEERKASFRHLHDKTHLLRTLLGRRIRHQVRIIPELRLTLDETELEAERIDRLFDRLRRERGEEPDPMPPPETGDE